jgi:uncharacterized damage-inducible protein DinB
MISPATLADAFKRNIEIIKMQTTNLSQEDSLVQLPFRGNCMNWIIGHILTNRYSVIKLLTGERPAEADQVIRYEREAEPITGQGAGVLPLEQLIVLLEHTQAQIAALLSEITHDDLYRLLVLYGRQSRTVAEWLMFLYFHDTYHTGQTEILRQASGKNDKII